MTDNHKGSDAFRPMPIDFRILELLPVKGQIGGIHWRGRLAKDVRQEILDTDAELTPEMLPMSMLQSRLRSMSIGGIVESFPASATGGKQIWARNAKGSALLAQKEEVLGG